MEKPVKTILVPVQLDDEYLAIARQAAEFARHQPQPTGIYLLHIEQLQPIFKRVFSTKTSRERMYKTTNEKVDLLNTWKTILEKQTGTPVTFDVDWGEPAKMYLHNAKVMQSDMIIIKEDANKPKWYRPKKSIAAYIISHFCQQVITLREGNKRISDWQHVVIPVTDFVPEKRIDAMVEIAREFQIKIHLVSFAHESAGHNQPEFYFLTETLKRFKSAGNILVECKCLPVMGNWTENYLSYCRSINADVLMTYQPTKEYASSKRNALEETTVNSTAQFS